MLERSSSLGLLRPVLDLKTRNASHVLQVRRDQDTILTERMCSNRGAEIFNPFTFALESRLDACKRLADFVGPHHALELTFQQFESRGQSIFPLRAWQSPFQAVRPATAWSRRESRCVNLDY